MNYSKKEFKAKYSAFRKELRHIFNYGSKDAYCDFLSTSEFKEVRLKAWLPTSIKIDLYKRGLLKAEYRNINFIQ
jgi:hypothetical protein